MASKSHRQQSITFVSLIAHFLVICSSISLTWAYIPATALNNTQSGPTLGNLTLTIRWQPKSFVEMPVLSLLAGPSNTTVIQGALVSFSEGNLTTGTSSTPWIALINCDSNTTNSNMDSDIFTEAKDRGAVAALLYSNFSDSCAVNSAFLNPETFAHPLGIFTTPTSADSKLLMSQFTNVDQTLYRWFDAARLNASLDSVEQTLQGGSTTNGTYLVAQLGPKNTTSGVGSASGGSGSGANHTSAGEASARFMGLATTILSLVVGSVSFLF